MFFTSAILSYKHAIFSLQAFTRPLGCTDFQQLYLQHYFYLFRVFSCCSIFHIFCSFLFIFQCLYFSKFCNCVNKQNQIENHDRLRRPFFKLNARKYKRVLNLLCKIIGLVLPSCLRAYYGLHFVSPGALWAPEQGPHGRTRAAWWR